MDEKLEATFIKLSEEIAKSYTSGVSLDEAEKLAGRFLDAQILVADALATVDLDARMHKTGLKAIKSGVRMNELAKHEKKPTEGFLDDIVNTNAEVREEQDMLDTLEVRRDRIQNYFNIFKEAHIYFRGVAKGRFE